MLNNPVYVIGHKNPDTDSIVSAIAYANLKNALGVKAVAGRLGGVSSETEYLLKRFGFEEPLNIFTAKSIIKEIDIDDAYLLSPDSTIKEALDLIALGNNRSVFIANNDKTLEGVIATDDFTKIWTSGDEDLAKMLKVAEFKDITKVLEADVIYEDEHLLCDGIVDFFPTFETKIHPHSIVVTNNSPEIQRYCLNEKIALLVIVGESWIDDVTLKKAKDMHVSVIATKLSPLNVSRLIYQVAKISKIMTPKEKVISFSTRDTVDEAGYQMTKSRFHAYPVLNHHSQIVGSIGRYHVLNSQKKRFILVDHNEMSQSLNDLEPSEIIEIVDHHRFGGLETNNPVEITTMVVGATATIVAHKYFENNVEMSQNMAGLLLGGIIADTMNFKSPTTTNFDIEMAKRLEKMAKVKMSEIFEGLINASESILNKRNIEIVYNDFKEFEIHNLHVGLAQTQIKNKDEFFKVKDKMEDYLNEVCAMQKYDLLGVMFTMQSGSGSYFLEAGDHRGIIAKAFNDIMQEDEYAPEIVSRKKQVFPAIIALLEKNR